MLPGSWYRILLPLQPVSRRDSTIETTAQAAMNSSSASRTRVEALVWTRRRRVESSMSVPVRVGEAVVQVRRGLAVCVVVLHEAFCGVGAAVGAAE